MGFCGRAGFEGGGVFRKKRFFFEKRILRSPENPRIGDPHTSSGRADKRSASATVLAWNAGNARVDSAVNFRVLG